MSDIIAGVDNAALAGGIAGILLLWLNKLIRKTLYFVLGYTRQGKHWTKSEEWLLVDMRRKGMSWHDISLDLKRTIAACRRKYYRVREKYKVEQREEEEEEQFSCPYSEMEDELWKPVLNGLRGK